MKTQNTKPQSKTPIGCLILIIVSIISLAIYCNQPSEEEVKAERTKISADSLLRTFDVEEDSITKLPLKIDIKGVYKKISANTEYASNYIYDFQRLLIKSKGSEFQRKIKKTLDSLIVIQNKLVSNREINERKAWELKLRNDFLDNNLDIKVLVHGKNFTSITLTYALFNDIWFRKFETAGHFTNLYNKGFKKITLTDGYKYEKWISYK